jgi:hypothetical protein
MPGKLYGAAAEFSTLKYGGGMAEHDTVVTVAASATAVLGNDPERVLLVLVNLSATNIYIGLNEAVGAANGILLSANGGNLEMEVENDLTLPIRALWGVADIAGASLYTLILRRESVVQKAVVDDANR